MTEGNSEIIESELPEVVMYTKSSVTVPKSANDCVAPHEVFAFVWFSIEYKEKSTVPSAYISNSFGVPPEQSPSTMAVSTGVCAYEMAPKHKVNNNKVIFFIKR